MCACVYVCLEVSVSVLEGSNANGKCMHAGIACQLVLVHLNWCTLFIQGNPCHSFTGTCQCNPCWTGHFVQLVRNTNVCMCACVHVCIAFAICLHLYAVCTCIFVHLYETQYACVHWCTYVCTYVVRMQCINCCLCFHVVKCQCCML